MSNEKEHRFGVSFTKKNPKPNAKTYEFQTVAQIFDALTEENAYRLLGELASGMRLAMAMREAADGDLKMEKFTWIDD